MPVNASSDSPKTLDDHLLINLTTLRPPRHQILIVLVQGMGDLVLAIPAIKAIRSHWPTSELTLAAPEGVIDILRDQHLVDHLFPLPQHNKRPATALLFNLVATTRVLAAQHFDLLVNLTTLLGPATYLRCRAFDALCRPSRRIGGRLTDCLTWWAHGAPARFRLNLHEVQMKFRLMHGLVPANPQLRPMLIFDVNSKQVQSLFSSAPFHRIRIGVCPVGAKSTQIWNHESVLDCLRRLPVDNESLFVFVGGPNDSKTIATLVTRLGRPALNCAGKCAVRDLPSLIAGLDVLLTNDTGPMHIAAAVGTPVVAIFGPGSPARYGPQIDPSDLVAFYQKPPCGPCLLKSCAHHICMNWIRPEMVARAVQAMLERRRAIDGRNHPSDCKCQLQHVQDTRQYSSTGVET